MPPEDRNVIDIGKTQSVVQGTQEAYARAYERGHFVAEQRAISRERLGLPVERGVEPTYVDMPYGMTMRHVIPGEDDA